MEFHYIFSLYATICLKLIRKLLNVNRKHEIECVSVLLVVLHRNEKKKSMRTNNESKWLIEMDGKCVCRDSRFRMLLFVRMSDDEIDINTHIQNLSKCKHRQTCSKCAEPYRTCNNGSFIFVSLRHFICFWLL